MNLCDPLDLFICFWVINGVAGGDVGKCKDDIAIVELFENVCRWKRKMLLICTCF
ncbi:hypothetical protein Hanom_Chr16g01418241 [Helianthus anomalus]